MICYVCQTPIEGDQATIRDEPVHYSCETGPLADGGDDGR